MRVYTVFQWTRIIVRALLTVVGVLITVIALGCFLVVTNALPWELP